MSKTAGQPRRARTAGASLAPPLEDNRASLPAPTVEGITGRRTRRSASALTPPAKQETVGAVRPRREAFVTEARRFARVPVGRDAGGRDASLRRAGPTLENGRILPPALRRVRGPTCAPVSRSPSQAESGADPLRSLPHQSSPARGEPWLRRNEYLASHSPPGNVRDGVGRPLHFASASPPQSMRLR